MSQDNAIYYTVAEVATKLRVCRMTVYRMVKDGELESNWVSRRSIRILASSVHAKFPELAAPSESAKASARIDAAAAAYGASIEKRGVIPSPGN